MYFGYETMWTFTFVQTAFFLVMTVGIALAFVWPVGAWKGRQVAARYTSVLTAVLLLGMAADLVLAVASGQWSRFVAAYGYGPVVELGLLAAMFLGAMWMMAASYVGSKR